MFTNQPTILILRSASGAGKTTLAKYIQSLNFNKNIKIVSADDFYTDSQGNYNFNPSLLGAAHAQCKAKFVEALEEGLDVIVANTNTARKDYRFYFETGKQKGYRVFSLIVENINNSKDTHGVPPDVLARQKETLKNNIDL